MENECDTCYSKYSNICGPKNSFIALSDKYFQDSTSQKICALNYLEEYNDGVFNQCAPNTNLNAIAHCIDGAIFR